VAAGDKYINRSRRNLPTEALLRSLVREDANGNPFLKTNAEGVPGYTEMIFTGAAFPVADPNNVADWNTLMVQSGTPYTSVLVTGDTVRLEGGLNIELKSGCFNSNLDIISVIDTGCITVLGTFCFETWSGIQEGNLLTARFSHVTDFIDGGNGSQFGGQTSLSDIYFPKLTALSYFAFGDCLSIVEADFPLATSIDGSFQNTGVFSGSMALTTFNGPLIKTVGVISFYGCVNLTTAGMNLPLVETIGTSAFYQCESLTSINFPHCTSVGVSAFGNCILLSSVNLPLCQVVAGFDFCSALTSINLPSCTTIGSSAFSGSGLTSITAPSVQILDGNSIFSNTPITAINFPLCTTMTGGANLFSSCTHLVSINLPLCVPLTIPTSMFISCSVLNSLIIDLSSVTSIGANAFNGCAALPKSQFIDRFTQASVLTIGAAAFSGCTGINGAVTFNSVTTLSTTVFLNCTGMTSITMNSLQTITGTQCFRNCTSVSSFSFPALTTISATFVFQSCTASSYNFPVLTASNNNTFFNANPSGAAITFHLDACVALGTSVATNGVFNGISGKTVTLYIPASRMTANAGNPDGDIATLQAANTVTVIPT
jgi:hypothetical protein